MSGMNQVWRLGARPQGANVEAALQWTEEPVAALEAGEVLVRTLWLSLDPTNRIWMNDAESYLPKLELGAVMRGVAIGVVEESRAVGLAAGDLVQGMLGWQRYAVVAGRSVTPVPGLPLPLEAHFGLLGHIGLSAYFGLLDIGAPKAGETLVVSAAAGAVGSLAGQIGKIGGLRVVGIAGGAQKCRWITEELGFDAGVDYKSENVAEGLRRTCPRGIDIDFENVGGAVLEAVLGQINLRARVILCGMISQYNSAVPPAGPRTLGYLLMKRARMEGFIVTDYLGRAAEAYAKLVEWHRAGRLKYRVDVVDGLANAPRALGRLFEGKNTGKLLVKVSEAAG
jgi:hypothetical protein